jgi:hypothetical protein
MLIRYGAGFDFDDVIESLASWALEERLTCRRMARCIAYQHKRHRLYFAPHEAVCSYAEAPAGASRYIPAQNAAKSKPKNT